MQSHELNIKESKFIATKPHKKRNHPTRKFHKQVAGPCLSLTQFVHSKSKGTRHAIEKYRQKKKSKFNHRAGLLREYRKVIQNEGYLPGERNSRIHSSGSSDNMSSVGDSTIVGKSAVADTGAVVVDDDNREDNQSKKEKKGSSELKRRRNDEKHKRKRNDDKERNDDKDHENDEKKTKRRKHNKYDPFAKARIKAKQNQEKQKERIKHVEGQLKIKKEKIKQRKQRSKIMSKRTRKGQPIMKNIIGSMLEKIQNTSS